MHHLHALHPNDEGEFGDDVQNLKNKVRLVKIGIIEEETIFNMAESWKWGSVFIFSNDSKGLEYINLTSISPVIP